MLQSSTVVAIRWVVDNWKMPSVAVKGVIIASRKDYLTSLHPNAMQGRENKLGSDVQVGL